MLHRPGTSEREVARPLIPLCGLTARCVAGEGCRPRGHRGGTGHRRRQALCRRVFGGASWDWSSSRVAFTVSRGPRGAAASAPSLRRPLFQQAIVPSAFRLRVGWSAQEPPFKFFPAVPGIPDQLSRRTPRSKPGGGRGRVTLLPPRRETKTREATGGRVAPARGGGGAPDGATIDHFRG